LCVHGRIATTSPPVVGQAFFSFSEKKIQWKAC
jgi:hypothetical protein